MDPFQGDAITAEIRTIQWVRIEGLIHFGVVAASLVGKLRPKPQEDVWRDLRAHETTTTATDSTVDAIKQEKLQLWRKHQRQGLWC